MAGKLKRLIERDVHDQNLRDAAYGAAYRKLAEHRSVACPKCRWYQRKMSRAYGMRRLVWMYYCGIGLLALAGAAVYVMFMFQDSKAVDREQVKIWWDCAMAAPTLAVAGGTLLYVRKVCAGRYDLNTNYPNHIAPLTGEPDAIVCRPPNPYFNDGIDDDKSGWFAARDGKRSGPYSWNQLYDLAFAGKLRRQDYVIPPDAAAWVEAWTISELGIK
jgi:hypothetical protein